VKYKILIMGLPGSGKTTLAEELEQQLINLGETVHWYNADRVRELFSDWDFSPEGRIRQAERMNKLAELSVEDYIIMDFVAPLEQMRDIVAADYVVWVDTIPLGRFEDTNKMFVPPLVYDLRVTEQNAQSWAKQIVNRIFEQQLPS
jgi:hypothetical protein